MKRNNQELRDAERKGGFIDRNADLYRADPFFRSIVDRTVYLTIDEKRQSESAVVTKFGTQWTKFVTIRGRLIMRLTRN